MKRSGAKNLFPALSGRAASDGFSKRFARYLAKTRCKTNKNCFHSFRHNFRDALREAGIEREVVQALGGWRDSQAGVEDNYGSGHTIKRLHDALCRVSYKLE